MRSREMDWDDLSERDGERMVRNFRVRRWLRNIGAAILIVLVPVSVLVARTDPEEFQDGVERTLKRLEGPAPAIAAPAAETSTGADDSLPTAPTPVIVPPAAPEEAAAATTVDDPPLLSPEPDEAYQGAMTRGNALRRERDAEGALLEFERAAELRPTLAQPRYEMGMCYLDLDKPEAAKAQFQRALIADPAYRSALQGLAAALRRMGEDKGAERVLRAEADLAKSGGR